MRCDHRHVAPVFFKTGSDPILPNNVGIWIRLCLLIARQIELDLQPPSKPNIRAPRFLPPRISPFENSGGNAKWTRGARKLRRLCAC